MKKITYIDEADIANKRVLLRVDYNVALSEDGKTITEDERIVQTLPTLKYLLKRNNKIIIVSHLGRPKERDLKYSLDIVVKKLQEYLHTTKIRLIDDFLTEDKTTFDGQKENEILVLENIRFYQGEKTNDKKFSQQLANLADVYVNDAFAVSHRAEASIVAVPMLLPAYGGLCLKKEVVAIDKAILDPQRPLVAIIGGAKISTKITLISKLIEKADYVILGGGLANVFFRAQRFSIGKSICEYEMVSKARQLLFLAAQKNTSIVLPIDAMVGDPTDKTTPGQLFKIGNKIPADLSILDIGPETKAKFGEILAKAKAIVWNGPVGLFENPVYREGTDFIFQAITHNPHATSVVGGGDTLAAINGKKNLDKITHISTGGGAMLEFIENGTLPGIEALKR